jgi:hypothetical protein
MTKAAEISFRKSIFFKYNLNATDTVGKIPA